MDKLILLHSGEDEWGFNYTTELSEKIAEACGSLEKGKETMATQKAIGTFLSLPTEDQKSASCSPIIVVLKQVR